MQTRPAVERSTAHSASATPTAVAKRRKGRGWFCWVCERMRPNERFSRKGRMRHVCRECGQLPESEIAYAQAMRNIGRLVGFSPLIKWKKRQILERTYLKHQDERVRECALRLLAEHALEVARRHAERMLEEDDLYEETLALPEAFCPTWMLASRMETAKSRSSQLTSAARGALRVRSRERGRLPSPGR